MHDEARFEYIIRVALTEIEDKPDPPQAFSKDAGIFGETLVDCCPCGTATSVAMKDKNPIGRISLIAHFG